MISLFLDTSTSRLIVGVYKDKNEIYFDNSEAHNDLSSRVLPKIKEALESVSLTVKDIDDIYVVNGPGSFTGIRVGVTIAKTLAWSLKKPIYTVSELSVLASGSKTRFTIPLIDARRGYVYAGIYNKNLKSQIEDQYILLEDLKKLVKKEYKKEDISFVSFDKLEGVEKPIIDVEKLLSKVKVEEVNPHLVNPNYLKKTEAEEKLNDKKA
ncbi:MAG: tRNA (adenosine(37)-N6)-threonylcarbamoyltransferase complex dimerization subunit type 1 TsaB [Bacilli bacterium]|nr:tRNA (adenosine(37)-N6)-threonylcarbamoyltransferase complex dimerization subunit type 1 TsaB [Bacilli bacterium]